MTLERGIITSVSVEKGVVKANVQTERAGVEKRDVPVVRPLPGVTYIPSQGDMVVMDDIKRGDKAVVGFLRKRTLQYPDHQTGDEFSFMMEDGTEFSYTKNGSGDYDVNISCSGDITVDGGSVVLGDSNNSEPIARKGDSVEVSTSEGTASGEITSGSSTTKSE